MMKTILLLIVSAAATFGSEPSQLRAEIRFPFRAFLMDMPAGQYEVELTTSGGISRVSLRNAEAGKQVVLHAQSSGTSDKPSLTFACTGRSCGLTAISMGDGAWYKTSKPKLSPAEQERMVTIFLNRADGD